MSVQVRILVWENWIYSSKFTKISNASLSLSVYISVIQVWSQIHVKIFSLFFYFTTEPALPYDAKKPNPRSKPINLPTAIRWVLSQSHFSFKIDSNCNTEGLKEFQKQNSEPLRQNYTAMFFRQQYQWVRFKKSIFCNDVMLLPNLWNSCLEDK